MNCRAKFDSTSFIVGKEIRNHTNTQNYEKKTVNDISTLCLSACVDNKYTVWRWYINTIEENSTIFLIRRHWLPHQQ